ncbi:MAG: hypothetical protein ACM359_01795 [Bacillota bacterium]
MAIWLQNLLVFAIVAVCLTFVLRQMTRTLRSGQGKIGACCSRGCQANQPSTPPAQRVVFLPIEALSRRR